MLQFQTGGTTVPRPPNLSAYGTMVGHTANEANEYTYRRVKEWVDAQIAAMAAGAIGDGKIGPGSWQNITNWLRSVGEPFDITSTYRPGSITRSGNLSLHAVGKAVDMVSGNMMRLFNRLLQIGGSLQELFYDPAGRSIKSGRVVNWTVGGHSDHVHAATFDRGGYLYPGWTLAYNGTGRAERVERAAQAQARPVGGASININFYGDFNLGPSTTPRDTRDLARSLRDDLRRELTSLATDLPRGNLFNR